MESHNKQVKDLDLIVTDGAQTSSRDLMTLLQENTVNNHTDELTDLFMQHAAVQSIGSLNINNSTNVHIGNMIEVHGNVKINQYIIEQTVYSKDEAPVESVKLNKKKLCTTIVPEDDEEHYDTDDDEADTGSPYDDILPDFHIITKKEWKARPSGPVNMLELPVEYVLIAHTATENCPTRMSCIYHMRYMQNLHIDLRRWSDIGYNFVVGGDGAVYEGRGWDVIGSHSRNFNSKCICIALIGTYCEVLPPLRQLAATKKTIELLLAAGKITKDYKLIGHRQVIPTLSPGEFLFEELQTWPHFCEGQISYPK